MVSHARSVAMSASSSRCVLVCQNRTCKKQGSAQVLKAFQLRLVAGVAVVGSGCLGQCGSGPMVKVVPDNIWYSRIHPDEVPAVIQQHLVGGQPVKALLYSKFHPDWPDAIV